MIEQDFIFKKHIQKNFDEGKYSWSSPSNIA